MTTIFQHIEKINRDRNYGKKRNRYSGVQKYNN